MTSASNDAWTLLHDLVATPSQSGSEGDAAGVLRDWLQERGLQPTIDAAGSVRATAGRGARHVLLAGHIDCAQPFVPTRIVGDTLWGRGAVDAKGPLSAFAAALLANADSEDVRVTLVACTGEEADSRGAHHLVDSGFKADALVVGEPSGAHGVTLGYKGRLLARITYTGETAHAGHADATPAERLARGWQRLQEASLNPGLDPSPSKTTPRLVALEAHPEGRGWMAGARVDVRIPTDALQRYEEGAFVALVEDAFEGATVEVLDATPPYAGEPGNAVAASFRAAIRAGGAVPRMLVKSGTSDLNILAPALGVPGVAYGPGDSALDHRPDERIDRREFETGIRVLQDAIPEIGRRASAAGALAGRL